MRKHEDFKNRALSLLLKELGVECDYEVRIKKKRVDILANVENLPVALEAETGFHRTAQAIKDADARLSQKLAIVAFAICYQENVTETNMAKLPLKWTIRTSAGDPNAHWTTGSVAELAEAVQQVHVLLDDADIAARLLSDELDSVAQSLRVDTRRHLARALDLPAAKSKGGHEANGWSVAAKRGMLVVATAMLFHHRVQNHLPALRPDGYAGPWPPEIPEDCAKSPSAILAFKEAWKGILAVDYRPVFETGIIALEALPAVPNMVLAIQRLADTVAGISQRVAGLRHDLLGRIFHRVLDTARYDGSFYTSTAAAVLLASLALREEDGDWGDPNAIANLRICDPACGTGTLLMAASERIRGLRMAVGPLKREDEEALGLCLVEDVLWGYDVNLTATHMAASAIGMLSPKTSFSRMNIHRTRLGLHEGEARLGSLDFLAGKPQLVFWPSRISEQVENGEGNGRKPPPMDLVIMNPPFTRDSLRHDQFSRAEEKAIKEREKEMLDDQAVCAEGTPGGELFRAAARLSGSSGPFVVLADRMCKADSGILAVILPTVMMTNPSAFALRKYLAQRFHIETIVSSHDPKRIFFSENTSIGEILLVCRRWNGSGVKPPTNVVNLVENPKNALESLDVSRRIEQAIRRGAIGPSDCFTLQKVDEERIRRGDWSTVNFLSPFLVLAYRRLKEGAPDIEEPTAYSLKLIEDEDPGRKDKPVPIQTVPLGSLAEVGPAGQRIRDAYIRSQMPISYRRRALWFHSTDVIQSMQADTDVYIEPKESKRHLADRYWEQKGRLLLPHRLWLPLARVAAVTLPEEALGSIWTPCRPHNPEITEAMCLYLNSSVGILALLGDRDNRKPSYPSFSLDTLRSMPVPDFSALDKTQLEAMKECYNRLKGETLLPLPQMESDTVRREIDGVVTEALHLDEDWVSGVRFGLSREPAITATSALA